MRSPGVSIWSTLVKVFSISVEVCTALRVLAQVKDFELNTSRDAIDISALSSEFKQQYSGLISGSGTVNCFLSMSAVIAMP